MERGSRKYHSADCGKPWFVTHMQSHSEQHFLFGIPGSDMYMAFGVKDLLEPGAPAQGDVVVGWINTKTGKGGLDDYFLSGAHTCSDGAESCPDTTKPGGQKNVEMLNSVSRDNYTMLTFRR